MKRPDAPPIDCPDVTFVIPVRIDTADRTFNLSTILRYLKATCGSLDVLVVEDDARPHLSPDDLGAGVRYLFKQNSGNFNKSENINLGLLASDRPIICFYDADILTPPSAICSALHLIRTRRYGIVVPHNRICVDVWGTTREEIAATLDFAALANVQTVGEPLSSPGAERRLAQGGVAFVDRKAIIASGAMNRRMASYGWEDTEFLERNVKLGIFYRYLPNSIVHLNHERGPDSIANGLTDLNEREYRKVRGMSARELRMYVADHLSIVENGDDARSDCKNDFRSGWLGYAARRLANKIAVEGAGNLLAAVARTGWARMAPRK